MRMGVLDIGSNTVHLLVVDARVGGAPVAAASLKRELRLAEHLDDKDRLNVTGRRALLETVAEAKDFAEAKGCLRVLPFVTSALREARNCDAVIAEVRERTGVELHVLSGVDESRATFLAARRWYGWSAGTLAVFDIGGGSLEIACGRDEEPDVAVSVPVGAGRMMRRFGDKNISKMRRHVRAEIGSVVGEVLRRGPFDRTVATSKTFRTLGRIAGAAPSSEGPYVLRTLSREQLSKWVGKLADMSPSQRAQLPGVSAGRAQQILAGAVVAEAVMDLAGLDHLDLCPWALREGIILNYLDHLDYFHTDGPTARRLDADLSRQLRQMMPVSPSSPSSPVSPSAPASEGDDEVAPVPASYADRADHD